MGQSSGEANNFAVIYSLVMAFIELVISSRNECFGCLLVPSENYFLIIKST